MCVAAPVLADVPVVNGTFDQGLAGTWQTWTSDAGDYTDIYWSQPDFVTIATTGGHNSSLNPVLELYRWQQDPLYAPAMAVGARQAIGGGYGLDISGYPTLNLKADITILGQSWANTGSSTWFPAMAGVRYSIGDTYGYAMKYFYTEGTSTVVGATKLNTYQTYHMNWDLQSALPQGSRLTGMFFCGQGDRFEAQFDNIQLVTTTVPEPTSFAAIAGAMSGLGLYMGRRRRA